MVSCERVMRPRLYWILAGVLAAAILFALWWLRGARSAGAGPMMAELPAGDGVTLFVNTRQLRRTGVLERLAGEAGAEEDDYRRFVEATGFHYRTDLDALLLRIEENHRFIVAAGRFRFDRLRLYCLAAGGRCAGPLCSLPGSAPERQISWVKLDGGLLGLAVSPDPLAAAGLGQGPAQREWQPPVAPAWIYIPGPLLKPGSGLPAAAAAFLAALGGARWAILSVDFSGEGLAATLEAPCPSPGVAAGIAAGLQQASQALKETLARERGKIEAQAWLAALADGRFEAAGGKAVGRWHFGPTFLGRPGR